MLGLGALTKGFPLVVAPVALAWLAARGERRAALAGRGRAGRHAGVVAGAARALADGFEDSLQYHLDRPAQVESSPAVVLTALEALGVGDAVAERSFGSAGVRHPGSALVLGLFTGLLAGLVALLAGHALRRRAAGHARRWCSPRSRRSPRSRCSARSSRRSS